VETILKITEKFVIFCVACFPVTTAVMIFSLKRHGLDPVGSHVKSNWSIDIDMKFFSNLRRGYTISKESKFIPTLNVISFYGGIFGLVVLPIVENIIEYW
jgi:hypothetical protein